jgi:hypothetical protein
MLIHHFDPDTKVYVSSEELESEVEFSTSQTLPEITENYTVAFIDGAWVSVLKSDRQIIDNAIVITE